MNLDADFEELRNATGVSMTDRQHAEVNHYVEHGEYGLALETWVDIISEEGLTVSSHALTIAIALAQKMQIPDVEGQLRLMHSQSS